MDASDIAHARLQATGLSTRRFRSPQDVVAAHLAVQAQDFGPAEWSLAQRIGSVSEPQVRKRIESGAILRTHVLRPTWHFVARDDIRWLLALTGPRVQSKVGPRYAQLGLDARTRSRAERAIARALRNEGAVTRADAERVFASARLDPVGQRLPFLLMHCELEAVVCSGPPRAKQQTHALLDERAPSETARAPSDPIAELVRRYLGSHGPATVPDIAWWSGLKVSELRSTFERLGSRVRCEEVGGLTFWSAGRRGTGRVPDSVYLLQAYDELVVGYTESRYVGDPRGAAARAAFKDRRLPTGTVLMGPRVAGHWRRSISDRSVIVEVLLYARTARAKIEAAVRELRTFLGREVRLEIGSMPKQNRTR